jgi:hypothetical protein
MRSRVLFKQLRALSHALFFSPLILGALVPSLITSRAQPDLNFQRDCGRAMLRSPNRMKISAAYDI